MAEASEPTSQPDGGAPHRVRADLLALGAGLAAVSWIPIGLWPGANLPAWPSASLGVVALVLAGYPGNALPRGVAAFLGLAGLLGGAVQIAAKWALVQVVP